MQVEAGTGEAIGGLLGYNKGTISESYAKGSVSGVYCVGGLVGVSQVGATILGSYGTGSVRGSGNYVGGLVGDNEGRVSTSYATGIVSGATYVGGLVGTNTGTINASHAKGGVSGSGNDVGGLVGDND